MKLAEMMAGLEVEAKDCWSLVRTGLRTRGEPPPICTQSVLLQACVFGLDVYTSLATLSSCSSGELEIPRPLEQGKADGPSTCRMEKAGRSGDWYR
jgi:hypothetical protein